MAQERVERTFEERQAQRAEKAKQRGASVIVHQTHDTRKVMNTINQLDRAFRFLRDRTFDENNEGYDMAKVAEVFKRYNAIIDELNKLGVDIAKDFPGIRYFDNKKPAKSAETEKPAKK